MAAELLDDINGIHPLTEVVVSPELAAEVEAVFAADVEQLDQLPFTAEQEATMGTSNKPHISTDYHCGSKRP